MSTVKVVTSLPHRYGKSCIIEGINVSFNGEGVAEVEEDKVDLVLVDTSISEIEKGRVKKSSGAKSTKEIDDEIEKMISELKKRIEELTAENDSLNKRIEELSGDNDHIDGEGGADPIDNPFKDMALEECKAFCKEAEYPQKEWSKLNEEKIRGYLFNKYKKEQDNKE